MITAHLNNLRISPRKVRLVAKFIVGMRVRDALRELEFMPKRSAGPIKKLLQSAVANAEHNFQLHRNDLIVTSALVNQGPTMKRTMPRARGSAALIRKRTSHVSVTLGVKEATKTKNLNAQR